VSHNFTVVRNTMPMSVWCDRELDRRIRDTWPKAAVGTASIIYNVKPSFL